VSSEENRAIGDDAVEQLANALRGAVQIVGVRQFAGEAAAAGLAVWASESVSRVERGGRLTREDGEVLWDRFGVRSVIITDVKVYEQVWGQHAKFTRAGIDALAVDLVADQVLWRRHGDAELEENRGRAFRLAMEQAVQGLANSICHRPTDFSVSKMWRDYRR
jgi:choline dehydrogenase-like flavoprotein